ncbi:aminotransferase class I/II-fold pyridoxal phosphate-dependent enzyme [Pseudomonas costantinii]|nr:aminotransferase class I/II-fold pyridoxal phosphate-dependent enzyme [Pseudomonas costantinii]
MIEEICVSDSKLTEVVFTNRPGTSNQLPWLNQLSRQRLAGPGMENNRCLTQGEAPATLCVHAGTYEDPITGAVGTPVFPSTTFRFSQTTYESFLEGYIRDIPTYSRYGNPGQWSVQLKVAALEGAQSALVLSSGMAAIASTLFALTNRNGHIISSYDLYGGSYSLLHADINQAGRSVSYVDPLNLADIRRAIRPETQIMFFELLSNPLMKAIDLVAIAALCKQENILLVVDNTFLSPISCRPLEWGADIVIHSATKYLNGHSDATCGAVAGSRKLVDRVWAQLLRFGGSLDPFVCFLLERGMKTLAVRMQAHANGARQVTRFLERHPRVTALHSVYAQDYTHQQLFEYSATTTCGMVSFEVEGGDAAALELLDRLKLITSATSLGGVESLVSLPFNTSHSGLTSEQQKKIGLNPGLVRLSVGIEDPDDLCADLEQALHQVYQGRNAS